MMGISRSPPSVSYPLGRSLALGGLLIALACAGLGVLSLWAWMGASDKVGAVWASFALWGAFSVAAFHLWCHQWCGVLRWDGRYWQLDRAPGQSGDSRALSGAPAVLLDLQSHLWISVAPLGLGRTWLWLEQSRQPERWLDLRRAVYSRATPGADDNADKTALAGRHGA
ncbi:hypothetical protein [Paracidovorax sp. MALMAid1276]|uniref:hypothetical protein n=1 Tax=Paracidovorax sp. MALMAid1276 TaxID=3411631 RepID=UPI003B9D8C58